MATKRRFSDLRGIILKNLNNGKKTVNQISSETGINWKTVDNHLIYLVGTGMAQVVFSSPYVKIFEITEHGKEYVEHLNSGSEKRVNRE
ncbi:ArsR family transcriptional regulator [Candidatus Woesearchaeota archaeon]|nr:ArsR family transcriptional regulator [Candidatus Woesearchaeota archaeon]